MALHLNTTGIPNKMPNTIQTKSYSDSFLYRANSKIYEKELVNFVMNGQEIDKNDPSMDGIKFLVKKNQITSYLIKVLDSSLVKLVHTLNPLPKIFKVFTAKDIKGDKKPKIFIDVSDLFFEKNGVWQCRNIDIFIAFLINAGNQIIYYSDPARVLMRDGVINSGTKVFSSLFTYIIDYLFKITAVSAIRDKCTYLSSMYYLVNILGKDITDTSRKQCGNIAKISEREEDIIRISIDENTIYSNFGNFIKGLADYLRLPKLTIDAFLEKWIYVFGTGTQFALELYPAFAGMITNVYVGCYLNNQKTIEKVAGRDVVDMSRAILKVCGDSLQTLK